MIDPTITEFDYIDWYFNDNTDNLTGFPPCSLRCR